MDESLGLGEYRELTKEEIEKIFERYLTVFFYFYDKIYLLICVNF